MSSDNDEQQKKKLFEFDTPEVGIRSVNLLNNLNITIPTSKWEITPRTATQSKRLKWDQTPFGVVKVESEIYKDNRLQTTSGFSLKQKQNDFMFNKRLTMDEINTILPKEGYSIYNVWNNEDIEQIDFQLFDEDEKLFFSELNETTDEDIKLIFKGLFILKKVKKNKSKRVLKIFTKVKSRNYALEKVILFCFSFDLSINEKSLILKIINVLLSESLSIFRREVFYILAKFSEEENLADECKESFITIFKNNFEDFKTALEREIQDCEKETKDLISRLLEMGIYVFGLAKNLGIL
ncbi:hypothetical protein NBO_146g0003 [Nosema bombycis CQ1]|uniref:Uncharacterized protein n=1 Tax=Nosema bombycis (strain CQ1 / CVCC 102059) TaxID=578461 RepID=R0MK54_NOSB1|nr:hypothetical protein NBO_146g0003 [Nosema bombycis CQ1]|eukprot:EOB13173.1 hypothetical protein NBO_146g0003 [Nosema bombycis CQ1]